MDSLNIAYASSMQTLDDYFRSNICDGRSIYCAFCLSDNLIERDFIKRSMISCGIIEIRFRNGEVLRNSSNIFTAYSDEVEAKYA